MKTVSAPYLGVSAPYLGVPGVPKTTPWGQGRCATTLLTEGACNYPFIRHVTYAEGNKPRTAPCGRRRGLRPMHATTSTLTPKPRPPEETFYTTHKQFHNGRTDIAKDERCVPFPSQHRGNLNIMGAKREATWPDSDYKLSFDSKPIIPANRLHLSSVASRLAQTSGTDMKHIVTTETTPPSYWSQYSRIHCNLGQILGPGVSRPYTVRQSYNVLTGEHIGPAWSEDNRTVSAGRVLTRQRLSETR